MKAARDRSPPACAADTNRSDFCRSRKRRRVLDGLPVIFFFFFCVCALLRVSDAAPVSPAGRDGRWRRPIVAPPDDEEEEEEAEEEEKGEQKQLCFGGAHSTRRAAAAHEVDLIG